MKEKFSHHLSHDWLSQFWRMKRWSERAKKALSQNVLQEEDIDDIYSFFISAFSLRDWLRKSEGIHINDLDAQLSANKYWGLCRDVANGLKHFDLTHSSLDPNFVIWCSKSNNLSQNDKEFWFILADGKLWSMLLIVDSISQFWTKLLTPYEINHQIIPLLSRNEKS